MNKRQKIGTRTWKRDRWGVGRKEENKETGCKRSLQMHLCLHLYTTMYKYRIQHIQRDRYRNREARIG